MNNEHLHIPVMRDEMLAAVAPRDGEIIVDCTFGAGGYTRALLSAATCKVVAFDRDPNVRILADALAREFPGHFLFLAARFSAMVEMLGQAGVTAVDAIVMDIGVSSMQFDEDMRGFSFQREAPLDMRMDTTQGETAEDWLNRADEQEIGEVIWRYGEERFARQIARAIIVARTRQPIVTTLQLAEIVAAVVRARQSRRETVRHPATRTFQALRIHVNRELEELALALPGCIRRLVPGGRLAVISFHSLEDRIVKQFIAKHSKDEYDRRAPFAAPKAMKL